MEVLKRIKIHRLIIFLFAFQSVFLIGRVILLGSSTSSGPLELSIALMPEIIIISIFIISLVNSGKNISLSIFDYLVIGYFFTNVVWGLFIGRDLLFSMHGIRLTYIPMLLYFIIRLNSHLPFKRIFEPLSYWFVVCAVLGLLLYFVFTSLEFSLVKLANARYTFYFIKRMGGLYLTPVLWGTFCATFALYFYFKYAKNHSFISLLAFEIMWLCLVLSVSRGAIIPFYGAIIVVTFIYKWYKPFAVIAVFSAIIFLVLTQIEPKSKYLIGFVSSSSVSTMSDFSSDDTQDIIEDGDTASFSGIKNTRVRFWALSLKAFKNNPQGYGLGKSGHVARQYRKILVEGKTGSIYSTDGWYLKLANETGIWGLISFFTLMSIHTSMCLRAMKKKLNSEFLFCFLVFCMVAIQNLMSNVLDFYSYAGFFWMIMGFSHTMINNNKV